MRRIAGTPCGVLKGLITIAVAAALGAGVLGASRRTPAPGPPSARNAKAAPAPAGRPALSPVKSGAASGPGQAAPAGTTPSPASSPLADRIARLLADPALGRMRIGVRVEALAPQPGLVFERDSAALFAPASNQKLLVTSAGVCLLGAEFAYRTVLGRLGRDLVIVGAGDPGFGDPKLARQADRTITAVFHDWAARLRAAGLTRIEGDLLFDDLVFDLEHMHPKWPGMFNLQSWYTAPVGGLNFNDNCVDVVVQRGPASGAPAVVTLIPNTPAVVLRNKAVTAGKGEPVIARSSDKPVVITVSGQVSRSGSADSAVSVPIVDPGEFFASAARTVLAAQGIEIAGGTRRHRVRTADGGLPEGFVVLAVHEQRLSELLGRMNRNSLNMCAEAVLKTLGAYDGRGRLVGQGTLATGRAAVARFLGGLGLAENLYVLDDGSGLSRDNRAAPVVFTAILRHMDAHPQREAWRSSLAGAGDPEGSLKRRMKDLRGRVFAKTGHIAGVSALSGYVSGPGGRRYAFSVLCNDTHRAKGGSSAAHQLQDNLCRLLAGWEP